mmetsp:Transcript_125705/g.361388  ORF Transcript_125705/g.361388 Transcript_125705/m.361388 type:complete len:245 (-) Transcript_125705:793-1527(-)
MDVLVQEGRLFHRLQLCTGLAAIDGLDEALADGTEPVADLFLEVLAPCGIIPAAILELVGDQFQGGRIPSALRVQCRSLHGVVALRAGDPPELNRQLGNILACTFGEGGQLPDRDSLRGRPLLDAGQCIAHLQHVVQRRGVPSAQRGKFARHAVEHGAALVQPRRGPLSGQVAQEMDRLGERRVRSSHHGDAFETFPSVRELFGVAVGDAVRIPGDVHRNQDLRRMALEVPVVLNLVSLEHRRH